MKKIYLLILIILFGHLVCANELDEIILDAQIENTQQEKDLIEGEYEVIYENLYEPRPYSKEALKGIVEKDYNINSNEGLFKNQLHHEFKHGIINDVTFKFGTQGNFNQNFSKESSFSYDTKLITSTVYGKFKNQKEGYNLLFDLTPKHDNFLYRLVLDAYIESNRIKNNKIIIGTSRPTVGIEGGISSYLTPFLNKAQTSRNFGHIRKTGLRLLGDYKYFDYDIGGYSSDTRYTQFFPGVETDLWLGLKPFANFSEKYGNLYIGGGYNGGSRNSKNFSVYSLASKYNYKKIWISGEYQYADGSNGYSGITTQKRDGYNITLGFRPTKKIEFLARYDDFDGNKKISKNNTKEYSAGINYYILGQGLKLIFNYIYCQNQTSKDSHKLILGTQLIL